MHLYYELSGAPDGPVLALANSLGSNLHMWDKALPSLERATRVLRFDTRGHGRSNVPSGPYSMEQLGNDLLFLLDYLRIRRVDLCGISLGGLVAMWAGIHAPDRLGKMILANTAACIGTRESWEQRIAMVRSSGMETVASQTLERWFTSAYRERHSEEMEMFHKIISATNIDGYCGCCSALGDTDLRDGIAAIEVPCLLITGTRDPVTPPPDGRALQAALRNSKYIELDTSHLSAWEGAEQFAGAILTFLRTGERSDG